MRQDHPLREVAKKVDFSFVQEEVKGKYGRNGNVSLDPEIVLKLMFLLFWDNVKSECELMKILPERLDYLWFLGYGLDDEIPNHSVLSKARTRWGGEVCESLFVRSVSQCVEAGLVGGDLLHMDGSLIDAKASRDTVLTSDPEMGTSSRGLRRPGGEAGEARPEAASQARGRIGRRRWGNEWQEEEEEGQQSSAGQPRAAQSQRSGYRLLPQEDRRRISTALQGPPRHR